MKLVCKVKGGGEEGRGIDQFTFDWIKHTVSLFYSPVGARWAELYKQTKKN